MRRTLLIPIALVTAAGSLVGCGGSNYPVTRVEAPANVTHEVAFGDYRRVFNTAYHIVNRYGVVQASSYRYGEITALVAEDNHLFDKTRREIQARIFDAGDYYEVECRVLIKVEQSEVATWSDQFQPRYDWRAVASDPFLETRLNNEIRAALSGGAWQAKEALTPVEKLPLPEASPPRTTAPQGGPREQKSQKNLLQPNKVEESSGADTEEVRVRPAPRAKVATGPGPEAFARLGVVSLKQGAFERAEAAFEATLQADARDPFAPFLLVQARFSRGDFAGAGRALREGDPKAWADRSLDVRGLYADGDRTFVKQLASLDARCAEDAGCALLLGYMRLHTGDAPGALAAFDRCAKDDAVARAWRARAMAAVDAAHGLEEF